MSAQSGKASPSTLVVQSVEQLAIESLQSAALQVLAAPPAVPDPAASAAVNAKKVILGRARECQRLRGRMPTIIAADQVTYGGLFAAVAKLNGLAR